MDKINPSALITDYDPVNEAIVSASNWYETQTCSLEDGSQLPWLFAQGWIIQSTYTLYDDESGRWTVAQWDLSRRVLKPELALQDLIISFTNAYNAGRILNDQRYDDLVSIYTVVLDKTEDEMVSLESDETTYEGLIETLIANITSDESTHNADVAGDLDDYGDSERARIDTQFDAQSAAAQASLTARGLYNTTVWNAVSAGIERERAVADTDVEDKILDVQMRLKDRLYQVKTEMRSKILAARDRLRTSLHDQSVRRVGLRNQVIQAMVSFMERREDSYPDIGSVGQLASTLGASNAAYPGP
jgi:hypothetical protein